MLCKCWFGWTFISPFTPIKAAFAQRQQQKCSFPCSTRYDLYSSFFSERAADSQQEEEEKENLPSIDCTHTILCPSCYPFRACCRTCQAAAFIPQRRSKCHFVLLLRRRRRRRNEAPLPSAPLFITAVAHYRHQALRSSVNVTYR